MRKQYAECHAEGKQLHENMWDMDCKEHKKSTRMDRKFTVRMQKTKHIYI